MPLPHSLRALRSGAFRRYYAGQAVSVLGTWIQSVALMWLAYRLSGSTVFTGLVGFLNSIPYLVLSPFAGVLGDRVDRRRILLVVLGLLTLQAALLAGLYYSLLDWYRNDYPYETGRTGKGTGRTAKSDYASYLQFMKNQLTELLTNYGEIMSIWFDGHWDQTAPEGSNDRSSRIDWKYNEIYGLIHKLQPQCMIGNNHHLSPLDGEDFQMFERDLPGENKSGLSFQKAPAQLPLET